MRLGGCSSVDIEIDAKSGEGILDYLVVLVHNILWGTSLLPSLDSNRHAMLIRPTDIKNILSLHPQISHIDIGRNIHSGKMSDMHRAIGVRQRAGHQSSFEFLVHYSVFSLPILVLIFFCAACSFTISCIADICSSEGTSDTSFRFNVSILSRMRLSA